MFTTVFLAFFLLFPGTSLFKSDHVPLLAHAYGPKHYDLHLDSNRDVMLRTGILKEHHSFFQVGFHMTTAMRKVHVDHEQQLLELDDQVRSLEELIGQIRKKKTYVRLAYKCFQQYVDTGSLVSNFIKRNEQDESEDYQLAQEVAEDFEEDLWKQCVASYGFEHVGHQCNKLPYEGIAPEIEFTLGLMDV